MLFNEIFKEVLTKEGIVSIVSWANDDAHVVNTWNSYLEITDNQIFIPAYAMLKTEANIKVNPKVKLTLGSKEVQGRMGMGTGFLIEGTGSYVSSGEIYEKMKEKCSFLTRVLIVDVTSVKQTV